MMHDFFLIIREKSVDLAIGLFWSFGIDDAEPIHDTVNMGIDTDMRCTIEYRENDLCRFYTDSRHCS